MLTGAVANKTAEQAWSGGTEGRGAGQGCALQTTLPLVDKSSFTLATSSLKLKQVYSAQTGL